MQIFIVFVAIFTIKSTQKIREVGALSQILKGKLFWIFEEQIHTMLTPPIWQPQLYLDIINVIHFTQMYKTIKLFQNLLST